MLDVAIYAMVYLGAALMVYNIYGFVRFVRRVRGQHHWDTDPRILYVPVVLLVLFLVGYLVVGVMGDPDLVVAGILFGGSVFVFIMYRFLNRVTDHIVRMGRLEAELMAAEGSSKAKSDFLASMSHEMRTPLNVIIGLSTVALDECSVPTEEYERFRKIRLSALHLLGIINNILDMGSVEAGTLALADEEFLLRDVVDQVDAIARTQCEEKGLDYELEAGDVADAYYRGDGLHIGQVLLSMAENAVKYTDAPGLVSIEVSEAKDAPLDADAANAASADAGGARPVRLAVSDTGVGMDESFVPKLFDAFTREDSSSTSRFGGSGLSLTVARGLVDAMGGAIEARSQKGEGSTFVVTLPLAFVRAAEPAPDPDSTDAEGPASAEGDSLCLEGKRVLIVEDIPENAEIVADLLELEDVETEHAQNGQVAVDMVCATPEGHYDAILMDLRMPVMDGLEATRRIRALEREDVRAMPIIALTANAFESDVRQSLEAGMTAHLAKPVDVDLLYTTLSTYIRNASRPERWGLA